MKATKTKPAARPHLVDEYADLERKLAPHRANLRRFEEVARLLRLAAVEKPGKQSVTIAGERYDVMLSPAGMKTVIASAAVLYEALGREKFLAVASTTLKALEEHVDPLRIATLTRQEQTGTRTITAIAKAKAARAKAA
jgi:hypothetical protein